VYTLMVNIGNCSAQNSITILTNPSPQTPFISTNSPICAGDSLHIGVASQSGVSYQWAGPNGFNSTSNSISINNTSNLASGVYTVTVSLGNCSKTATTTIVVNAKPNIPIVNNTGSYCAGDTIFIGGNSQTGVSYTWTGPNNFTTATLNPIIVNATSANSGVYTLVVSNGFCSAQNSTTVQVNPSPTLPFITSNSPLCGGDTLMASTSPQSGANYQWLGPNGYNSSLAGFTIANASTAASGTYSLSISIGNCTKQVSTSIIVHAKPSIPTALNTGPYCASDTVFLGTNMQVGVSYLWTGPNNFTSGNQNPAIINATTASSGMYTIQVNNGNCSAQASTNVVVNPSPNTPIVGYNGPVCTGNNLEFYTQFNPGTSYNWSGPNNFTATNYNPLKQNVSVSDSGLYTLTVNIGACSKSASLNVVVHQTPPTPVIISNSNYCTGDSLILSANAPQGVSVQWYDPAFNQYNQTVFTKPNISLADSGVYEVYFNIGNCTAYNTAFISVSPSPQLPIISSNSPICEGDSLQMSAAIQSGAGYQWSGPSGFNTNTNAWVLPNSTINNAGMYTVNVHLGNCTKSATANIVVNAKPSIPTVNNTGPYCAGDTIFMGASTQSGVSYTWAGPNNFTSSNQNPIIVNSTTVNSGTYTLLVNNGNCSSQNSTTVLVNASPQMPIVNYNGPLCSGNTLELLTPFNSGTTYLWTGPNAFGSTMHNPIKNNINTSDSGMYSLVASIGNCSKTANIHVVVNQTPPTPILIHNSPYCTGDSIVLSSNVPTGVTAQWITPLNNQVNQAVFSKANINMADSGIYVLHFYNANCVKSDSVSIEINEKPHIQNVSANGPVCKGDSILLQANASAFGVYQWTGPNTFSSNAQNPMVSNASFADSGLYTLLIQNLNCVSNVDSVWVNVHTLPSTATYSGDVCEGGDVQFNATSVNNATYEWRGPNAYFSTLQNPLLSQADTSYSGVYILQAVIGNCKSDADTIVLQVNTKPNLPIINAQSEICENENYQLSTPPQNNTSYFWYGPSGFSSSVREPLINSISSAQAGMYYLYLQKGNCTSDTSSITLLVKNLPPTLVLGSNSPICENDSLLLFSNAQSGATIVWNGPNTFNSGLQNPFINNAATANSGLYESVQIVNACTSAVSSINVIVNATPAEPIISKIAAGVLSSNYVNGNQWYIANEPVPGATGQLFTYSTGDVFRVLYTDANTCSAISAPFVALYTSEIEQKNIHIYPNPFNNRIQIEGDNLAGSDIEIYNVLGKRVFYDKWSKSIEINNLSPGVYYVRILKDNEIVGEIKQLIKL
jgi:hypothetical protein